MIDMKTSSREARTYNLGPICRIPIGEGRAFQIGQIEITIFRTREEELFATQAMCPHRGGPLADGLIGGGKVICPLHGYKFRLATGQALGHQCGALKTYPVTVNDSGDILLTVESNRTRSPEEIQKYEQQSA